MDSPISPQLLTSTGRRCSNSNSPEFEFWMLRNPSFPEPNLLSADELFVDGVLLPLHLLHLHNHHSDPPDSQPPNSQPEPGPQISYQNHSTIAPADSTCPLTSSKRWKDIFKKGDKKTAITKNQQEKEKKREKKSQSGASSSSAELNIFIWPFSRSRSAGNNGSRPRAPTTRKVSSAPCSRSNSTGESKSRKWSSSPGRAGVHLGRSSPVWQVRRGAGGSASKGSVFSEAMNRSSEKASESRKTSTIGGNSKSKVVNLNVPNMCRQHLSCRSDENRGVSSAGGGKSGRAANSSNSTTNLFNLRSLFSKKVY